MIKLCLYLTASISVLGNALIAPALGAMQVHFADVDPLLIRLIISISSLFMIPSALLSNSLAQRFGSKNILLSGLLLFGISGVMAGLLSNIYAILASRAFLGFSIGLIAPISQAYPTYLFDGEEKNTILARQSSSISIGNLFCGLLAGYLAYFSWRYSFSVYAIAFPVFIVTYLNLPDIEKEEKINTQLSKEDKKNDYKIPSNVRVNLLLMFVYMIIFYAFITNIALIIEEREIGSPKLAGYAFALTNLCSFFCSYNFSHIFRKFGKYTLLLGTSAMTIGYALLYFAHSIPLILLACMVNAIFMGLTMPYNNIDISKKVEKRLLVKVMSSQMVCLSLGQFTSPLIMQYIPKFPNYGGSDGKFLSLSFIAFSATILFFVLFSLQKKKISSNESEK